MNRRRLFSWFAWMAVAFFAAVGCSGSPPANMPSSGNPAATPTETVELTVSAAASLQDALKALQPIYAEQNPAIALVYNFGSSGSLQQQIEQGAPVDVFFSASPQQINALDEKNLLIDGTRHDVLGNSIVLVTPADKTDITDFTDLDKETVTKISIGEPSSVPAGKYSQEVLESMGLYDKVSSKIVFAKDVRQVLSYVEMGNVDAGLVYNTDAIGSDKVRVVATAPDDSHSSIIYPVAAIADSAHPEEAKAFVEFLMSDDAIAIFESFGFRAAQS
jgi:molybdate transport system substrate-binding protein